MMRIDTVLLHVVVYMNVHSPRPVRLLCQITSLLGAIRLFRALTLKRA
jgi:hypothetical protein